MSIENPTLAELVAQADAAQATPASDATPTTDTTPAVEKSINLFRHPLTSEAYQYLKGTGLIYHVRWNSLVALAKAAGRQVSLDEAKNLIATTGSEVTCESCGKAFAEPNVLTFNREPNSENPRVPELPAEMSAFVHFTKGGDMKFQGATIIVADGNGGERAISLCGPLYFNRVNLQTGAVGQIWNDKSCLGLSMKAQKQAVEAQMGITPESAEDAKKFVSVVVPAPLTREHAERILAAKKARQEKVANASERAKADAEQRDADIEKRRSKIASLISTPRTSGDTAPAEPGRGRRGKRFEKRSRGGEYQPS